MTIASVYSYELSKKEFDMTQWSDLGDINTLPSSISDERLNELSPALARNDISQENLNEIILGFIRIAFYLVNKISLRKDYQRLWLQAEALYALTRAVDRAKGRQIENLKGYFVTTVDRHIKYKSSIIKVPPSSNRARVKRGLNAIHITVTKLLKSTAITTNKTAQILEEIRVCAEDEVERQIIELKRAGFKDLDVAEQLNCSRQYVSRVKRKIKLKFRLRNDEWGEF
jgi:hypothetical protein